MKWTGTGRGYRGARSKRWARTNAGCFDGIVALSNLLRREEGLIWDT